MEAITFQTNQNCQAEPISDDDAEAFFVEMANRERGNLTGYDCQKCMNRGFFWEYRDGYRFCRECECMDVRKSIDAIRKSGLEDFLNEKTFSAFQCKAQWRKDMKSRVLQFVGDRDRGWLLLSGQPGCGKTHLATAAAGKFLRAGASVRYMRWVEDGTRIKANVNDDEAYEKALRPLKSCKVLYIDDLFKRKNDQRDKRNLDTVDRGDIRLAFEILDHRYVNRMVTIISTERTLDELYQIDEATGSRIYERSKKYQLIFDNDPKKNFRIYGDG